MPYVFVVNGERKCYNRKRKSASDYARMNFIISWEGIYEKLY